MVGVETTEMKRAEEARARTEEALRTSVAMLRRAENVAHLGHWRLELPSRRLAWSEEAYRVFGVTPDSFELSHASVRRLVHPDDLRALGEASESWMREGSGSSEFRIPGPGGTVRYAVISAQVERDVSGTPIALFGTFQDTTELRRTERELREKNVELERFTYMISHDLKSPLVTIRTFLGYLEQDLTGTAPGPGSEGPALHARSR